MDHTIWVDVFFWFFTSSREWNGERLEPIQVFFVFLGGYVCSAYEVLAAATEVFGVPGRRQSTGGSAGAPRGADAAQVQHGPHPRAQRVPLCHS